MQDNIDKIVSKALGIDKSTLSEKVKLVYAEIKDAIISNKDLIKEANVIDKKNNNGFLIDINIIKNIFSNLDKENVIYGNVIISEKDPDNNIFYGKQIMDVGNVVVINDGNPYVIIEMALRNIMVGNTVIFVNEGYMYGTNNLLIEIIRSCLEKAHISKDFVQMYVTENYDEVLNNFANIDLVVCIGDHNLQRLVLSKSKNKTIVSGYENFDLYIEDLKYVKFLEKILNQGLNIQVYLNSNLDVDVDNSIIVSDIDEAIGQINYNGNRYSTAIFTDSKEHASKFIREVKSKQVTVNTSPTIERLIDIKQSDLVIEKTIIYPVEFKFAGEQIKIDLN